MISIKYYREFRDVSEAVYDKIKEYFDVLTELYDSLEYAKKYCDDNDYLITISLPVAIHLDNITNLQTSLLYDSLEDLYPPMLFGVKRIYRISLTVKYFDEVCDNSVARFQFVGDDDLDTVLKNRIDYGTYRSIYMRLERACIERSEYIMKISKKLEDLRLYESFCVNYLTECIRYTKTLVDLLIRK